MKKINTKIVSKQLCCGFFALMLLAAYFPNIASAAQVTARKVVIGSSIAGANTTYNFTFTAPTSTTIKSIKFQACDNASGACTQAGSAKDFSAQTPGSTLTGQPTNLGSGGSWTVDNTDATSLKIKNTSNTGNPSAGSTVSFSNVHNPSATNSTFFIRITTYSDDAWTTAVDTGTVATSTAGQVTVSANVDETLTFTLGTASVALGTLTSATTGKGTSTMTVGTNAATGYSVSYSAPDTLASGTNKITAMSGAASSINQKQFGINLVSNTTPAVGANVSGVGSGTVASGYQTTNQFKFIPAGEAIATASAPTNSNVFTTSYIANVDDVTAAGAYSTAITYVATANF